MTVTFSQLNNINIAGRLGNNLFQIAVVVSMALNNNDKYIFPHWKYENTFNINNCFSDKVLPTKTYREPFFHYQSIPDTETKNITLDLVGYWQSHKYFQNYENIIKTLLMPKDCLPAKQGYASIHIRRGDYLKSPNHHPALTMDYYQKAMDIIKSEKYIIVSDDLEWCRKNFIGKQFEFSDADEITDLKIQIACDNNIIANSSFSWWGAYLNPNSSKKVIAPQVWFGSKLPNNTKDLYLQEWVII
jgi:hypothetical protein